MEDINLLKSELAMYGIKVAGDNSLTYRNGKEMSLPISDMIVYLKKEITYNKSMFFELWRDLKGEFQSFRFGTTASNESTQRMFITAIKKLYNLTKEINVLNKYSPLIKQSLNQDILVFNENFMSAVIDYNVGINWVDNLVRYDLYRTSLLRYYAKEHEIKIASYSDENIDINGIQGPWSNVDLPMRERVWSYSEDEEDFNNKTEQKQQGLRYRMQDTYNTCDEFEQGFYWTEPRNQPYLFDDDTSDPYPHDNRWFKAH